VNNYFSEIMAISAINENKQEKNGFK